MRWLQTVALPDIEVKAVTHQQLLRSMDALMDNQDAVDGVAAGLLRPLVDRDLSLAFYDMTKHTWSNVKYSRQIFSGYFTALRRTLSVANSMTRPSIRARRCAGKAAMMSSSFIVIAEVLRKS